MSHEVPGQDVLLADGWQEKYDGCLVKAKRGVTAIAWSDGSVDVELRGPSTANIKTAMAMLEEARVARVTAPIHTTPPES